PKARLASHIRDRREFSAEHRQHLANRLSHPELANQSLFCLARPQRHRRHASIGQPRLSHDAIRIQVDPEAGRDRANIHLPSSGYFAPFAFPSETGPGWKTRDDDGLENLAALKRGLPIADEELLDGENASDGHPAGLRILVALHSGLSPRQ